MDEDEELQIRAKAMVLAGKAPAATTSVSRETLPGAAPVPSTALPEPTDDEVIAWAKEKAWIPGDALIPSAPKPRAEYLKGQRYKMMRERQLAQMNLSPEERFVTEGGLPAILSLPGKNIQEGLIAGLDKVLGPNDTSQGTPRERAFTTGLAGEVVNRLPDTKWATIPGAILGVAGELGTDPTTYGGAGAGAGAAKAGAKALPALKEAMALDLKASLGGVPLAMHELAAAHDAINMRNWLQYGAKGAMGPEAAGAIHTWQAERQAIPLKAGSEGSKIAQAFGKLDPAQSNELQKAVYEFDHYGTPIPEHLKQGAAEAMAVLRQSQSAMDELRMAANTVSGEVGQSGVKGEYPTHRPRYFEEPIREAAEKGRSGAPKVPGILAKHEREDAYNLMAHGLAPEEAQGIIDGMPPELRPVQPTAPTMSKGLVEKVGDGTFLKWPNTEAGREGRRLFTETTNKNAAIAGRDIHLVPTDPIASYDEAVRGVQMRWDRAERNFELGEATAEDMKILDAGKDALTKENVLTPITDLPTIMSRGWSKVLQDSANDKLFRSLVGAVDSHGDPLTVFVPRKGVGPNMVIPGEAPQGYRFMLNDAGQPERRWGVLNAAEEEGKKGHYAVREDLADYLKNIHSVQDQSAAFFHDALDTIAKNMTNAPQTGVMNALQNKLGMDTINGVSLFTKEGRMYQSRARAIIRAYEGSGVLPREIEEMSRFGLIQSPLRGLTEAEKAEVLGFEDKVASIFESVQGPAEESAGKKFVDVLSASPLAEKASTSALGGFIHGTAKAAVEGGGIPEILLGGAEGAAVSVGARPFAKKTLHWFGASDEASTIAAYLHHKDEFLKQGLSEADAIEAAGRKTQDLTQAGWWGRLGGFSEVAAAAPGTIVAEKSIHRAMQKALVNRFLKWNEVQTRILGSALTKYGPTEKVGALAAISTLGAVKYGGRTAAIKMGLITPEEADRNDAMYPGNITVPVYDAKQKKMVAVGVNGRAISANPLDLPDMSVRGLLNKVTGPGAQAVIEVAQLASGGDPNSLFGGMPIRRVDIGAKEKETPFQAAVRTNMERFGSPWSIGGRLPRRLADQLGAASRGDAGAPTPGEIVASPFIGTTKEIVPKEQIATLSRAWAAQAADIVDEQKSVGSRIKRAEGGILDTASQKKIEQDQNERLADLAEDYLKKGLPEAELFRTFSPKVMVRNMAIRRILVDRGVLSPPVAR